MLVCDVCTPILPLSVQGIVHPAVARLIWAGHRYTLSPFRYCTYPWHKPNYTFTCGKSVFDSYYILDFAGGGAVHLLGEHIRSLCVCVFVSVCVLCVCGGCLLFSAIL